MKQNIGLTNKIQLRFLNSDDVDEVKSLCCRWFPINYPDSWYHDITSNARFYSLAAILNKKIIAILVSEVKSITKCNPEDGGILAGRTTNDTKVAYILSLGVIKEYRKIGIASLLLNNLFGLLSTDEYSNCKKKTTWHHLQTFKVHSFFIIKRL
ncbi:N-alpha-acetyltransferase 60-like isoform X2 [Xenia sp. Carnegie-2017]|uniref:N-alpha-acetyltransferase 60-like isoform X2 n=1 Tax=Xenia sp. Carnegie-2017 TaxID=2897299 RepID=UPI001F03ED45|nr:N-alpha-acetyltransferase 60-like isoform X2 [Xenia sp. Carnegie-2017]